MDESLRHGPGQPAGPAGHHRATVIIVALLALALIAAVWLLAAPAAGALVACGAVV